jgi:maleate isomerase
MPLTNTSPGAAYGWRARIGMLQPTMVSDTNPVEFYLMAPAGVQLVLTSLGLPDGQHSDEDYLRAIAGIETPLRRLLGRKVDAIVQAGVPPIVMKGWGFEDELRGRVAQLTDVPFASDVGCSIAAMQALGMNRIGLLASEHYHRGFAEYVRHAGIDTIAFRDTPPEGQEPSALPLSVPYRSAVALHRSAADIDGIWIPIASRPSVGAIEAIERDTGIPVVTSAQAMMWQALRMVGVATSDVVGFGRLFQAESDPTVSARQPALQGML